MKMTNKQRGSLHVWLDQWAFALREEGVTMDLIVRTLATRSIEAKPTKMLLKELVWKPVQEKLAAVMSSEKPKSLGWRLRRGPVKKHKCESSLMMSRGSRAPGKLCAILL